VRLRTKLDNFFSSILLFLCQMISKAQFSIKFSRLHYFHKRVGSSEKARRGHAEHLLLYPLNTTKLLLMPRRARAAHTHRPAPQVRRTTVEFMLHTSKPKGTLSGICAHTPLLHFQECGIPRSPSSASAALPQLRYLTLQPFALSRNLCV